VEAVCAKQEKNKINEKLLHHQLITVLKTVIIQGLEHRDEFSHKTNI